eukprot:TRINITY_DN18365_c0_g1_i4.p1 TRINITY_DN18365_c0_g1~~TRINITY_DN18365_c0_g1_i4.p1  ORF type:complete len:301 (-),score=56.70 TRINITY_DN18365_c0_g1_i4:252-1154(-)
MDMPAIEQRQSPASSCLQPRTAKTTALQVLPSLQPPLAVETTAEVMTPVIVKEHPLLHRPPHRSQKVRQPPWSPLVAESAATAMNAIIADTTEARGSDKKDDNGDASESGAANSLVGNGSDEGDDGHVGKGSGCGSWGSEREACVNLSHAIAVSRDGVSSGGMQTDTCTCGHCEDAKPKRCAVCLKSAVNPSIANKDEANTVGEGSSGSRDGGNGCGNGVGDGGNGVVGGGTLVGAVANVVGSAAPQSERQPMQKATPVVDPALQKGRKSKGSEIRSSSSIGRGYLNAIKRDKDIPRTPR